MLTKLERLAEQSLTVQLSEEALAASWKSLCRHAYDDYQGADRMMSMKYDRRL